MSWPRIWLWVLLLTIALAAAGFGAYRLNQRAARLRMLSQRYATKEKQFRLMRPNIEMWIKDETNLVAALARDAEDKKSFRFLQQLAKRNLPGAQEDLAKGQKLLANNRAWTNYYAALKLKYDYAARYRWPLVAPDPPTPPMLFDLK